MNIDAHSLFLVRPLVDCVLDYAGIESRCYWICCAASNQDPYAVLSLLSMKQDLNHDTVCAIAKMHTTICMRSILPKTKWSTCFSQLCQTSTVDNFKLLLPHLTVSQRTIAIQVFGRCTIFDQSKLHELLLKYPQTNCDSIFDICAPNGDAKLLIVKNLYQKGHLSKDFLSKQISFCAKPDLVTYCLQHCSASHASAIRMQLMQHAHHVHKAPVYILKLLSQTQCILPSDRSTYCWEAFKNSNFDTMVFFNDPELDMNVFYGNSTIQCSKILGYHLYCFPLSPRTLFTILNRMTSSCFHLAPQILHMIETQSCETLSHESYNILLQRALSIRNVPLLLSLKKLSLVIWNSCWQEVLVHVDHLSLASLIFVWNHVPTLIRNNGTALIEHVMTRSENMEIFEFCVANGFISKHEVARKHWNVSMLYHALSMNIFCRTINPYELLHNALVQGNEHVVMSMMARNYTLPINVLAQHASFLSFLGLVAVLASLTHVHNPESCYGQMHSSLSQELVRVLWRIAPLTRTQLLRHDLFWRIARKQNEAALFIWRTRVLKNDDMRYMTHNIQPQYKPEATRFLESIHYDF